MKVRMDDGCAFRYWVSSESEGEVEYVVDLCEFPLGNGLFNGACGLTNDRIHGCRDFIFRCEKNLKDPANAGKVYRCKHIRLSREHALDLLLPYIKQHDPNTHEDFQT